jgi:uncharacterized radical SAM superfamily Fe-S cluster-containing enzyme
MIHCACVQTLMMELGQSNVPDYTNKSKLENFGFFLLIYKGKRTMNKNFCISKVFENLTADEKVELLKNTFCGIPTFYDENGEVDVIDLKELKPYYISTTLIMNNYFPFSSSEAKEEYEHQKKLEQRILKIEKINRKMNEKR